MFCYDVIIVYRFVNWFVIFRQPNIAFERYCFRFRIKNLSLSVLYETLGQLN